MREYSCLTRCLAGGGYVQSGPGEDPVDFVPAEESQVWVSPWPALLLQRASLQVPGSLSAAGGALELPS